MKVELEVFLCAACIQPVLWWRRLSSIPSLTRIILVLSLGVTISTTPAGIAVAMTRGKVSGVRTICQLQGPFTVDACLSDKKIFTLKVHKGGY
jgi:hypothetical protein